MIRGWAVFCALCFFGVGAGAEIIVKKISTDFKGDVFSTSFSLSEAIDPSKIPIEYLDGAVQFEIPNVKMRWKSDIRKIEKGGVSRVHTEQVSPENLRVKIFSEESVSFEKQPFEIEAQGRNLVLKWSPQAATRADLPEIRPLDLDEEISRVSATKAENSNVEVRTRAIAQPIFGKPEKLAKESEIPVFRRSSTAKFSSGQNYWVRLGLSFGLILVLGLGMIFVGRWWKKNYRPNSINTKIRVLTQFHLGPRKSLAIIHVAGESLLIGVTDHNISILKTLSLIDDEIPESAALPKRFAETIEEDSFSLSPLKDVVSRRLKGMKDLS